VTRGALFFINVSTLEKLEIQFIPKLSASRQHRAEGFEVIGRNTPAFQSSGGSSAIDLKLDFYSQNEDRKDVLAKVRWLESMAATDGYYKKAPNIKLVWGKMYKNQLWVVKSVETDFELYNKMHGFLPQQAYVNLKLELDYPNKNIRWRELR
jgi:hypothetical protein